MFLFCLFVFLRVMVMGMVEAAPVRWVNVHDGDKAMPHLCPECISVLQSHTCRGAQRDNTFTNPIFFIVVLPLGSLIHRQRSISFSVKWQTHQKMLLFLYFWPAAQSISHSLALLLKLITGNAATSSHSLQFR